MKKSKEMIEEIYIVTNREQIEFVFQTKKTKRGKIKNNIKSYKSDWFANVENKKKFEQYLKSCQKENPNVKIHFITRKQLKKNKKLKNIVRKEIQSRILDTLRILGINVLIFIVGSNSILFSKDIFFYIYSTLTPIIGAAEFLKVKKLIQKMFPNYMKLAYTLQALLCSFVLSLTSLYSVKREEFFRENRIENTIEDENSIFNSLEYPEEKIGLLTNTLENNENLTEEEIRSFQNLHSYYLENPYLDYEYLNKIYANLEISRENISGIVVGQVKNSNILDYCKEIIGLETYNKKITLDTNTEEKTEYHEKIHLTGEFPYNFLNEGMTVCLTDEFNENSEKSSTNDYYQASVFIRLLSELVGEDAVLESYSKRDIRIINERLREIIPDTELLKEVYHNMESLDGWFTELQLIAMSNTLCNGKYNELVIKNLNKKYEKLLRTMNPYFEEKWGINVNNISMEDNSSLPEQYMRIILEPNSLKNQKTEDFKKYFNTNKQYIKTR